MPREAAKGNMANKHENLNTNPGNLDKAALLSPISLYVPYSYRVGFITLNFLFFFYLLSTLLSTLDSRCSTNYMTVS